MLASSANCYGLPAENGAGFITPDSKGTACSPNDHEDLCAVSCSLRHSLTLAVALCTVFLNKPGKDEETVHCVFMRIYIASLVCFAGEEPIREC